MGYAPLRVDLRIDAGDNPLTIELRSFTAALDEVRVTANAPLAARLDDFELRRQRGEASNVITRSDIDRRRPIKLSQMLRGMAGIRIADSSGSIVAYSSRGFKPSRNVREPGFGMVHCVLRVLVEGGVVGRALPCQTPVGRLPLNRHSQSASPGRQPLTRAGRIGFVSQFRGGKAQARSISARREGNSFGVQ